MVWQVGLPRRWDPLWPERIPRFPHPLPCPGIPIEPGWPLEANGNPGSPKASRAALVHDWLVTWGGAESVLQSLANLFPEAPIYVGVWSPYRRVQDIFAGRSIRTTWLQRIPGAPRHHRAFLPLFPSAFRSLDLSAFPLVISDSHAFSKAVRVGPGGVHVCYCHTPPRYLWDLTHEYLGPLRRTLWAPLLSWLRAQDLRAARGVTFFLANSHFVAERIHRIYGRRARVVYPPVDVETFASVGIAEGEYFLAGGRLVPYKRVDDAIRAANFAGLPLLVFGDGPERRRLEKLAGPTVHFLGWLGPRELARVISRAKALLFPGVEDFGILPVEVMAVGKPVVAYDAGGARETVVHGLTGLLYQRPGVQGLLDALRDFQDRRFSPEAARGHAWRFHRKKMEAELRRSLTEFADVLAGAQGRSGRALPPYLPYALEE